MPLLGKRIFDASIQSSTPKDDTTKPFVIQHTKEVFYSDIEYEERVKLYESPIWKCQCTGRLSLTHKEALELETNCKERLAKSFGKAWEEPILRIVHHSLASLDNIVTQVYNLFHTQLQPGESVTFSPKLNSTYQAKILKCLPQQSEPVVNGNANHSESSSSTNVSPASDKENKGRQALITDLFISGNRRSPRASSFAKTFATKEKKLKLLPLQYSILLAEENKIVDGVPCEYLTRIEKPPNRELIRLFIRASAMRPAGLKERARWVVDETLVFRHNIKSLISEEEENRLLEYATVTPYQYNREKEELSRQEKLNESIIDCDDLDEFSTLLNTSPSLGQKRKVDSPSLSNSKRPKQEKSAKRKSGKASIGMDLFLKRPSDSQADSANHVGDDFTNASTNPSPDRVTGSSRKNSSPRKKKQATILELTKKGKIKLLASRTPARSNPSKGARKPPQPIIVRKLLALKKEKVFRARKYKLMITAACKILNKKQLLNLPPELKEEMTAKHKMLEMKKRYQSMTPEEKKKHLMEMRKKKQGTDQHLGKFEDQHLVRVGNARTLPTLELVSLPDSLPNTIFGDIAMVCEFLHSYHALLSPKDPNYHKQFTIQTISDALTSGSKGFTVISKIVVLLLQTLLADDIAKDYTVLDYNLNKIHVTPEICCELVRICLRQNDEDIEDNADKNMISTKDNDLTNNHLFEQELFEMDPTDQVEVLALLSYRVMNTYAVQIHMEGTSQKAAEAWSRIIQQKKEKKRQEKEKNSNPVIKENNDEVSKQEENQVTDAKTSEAIDLISRVKNRKLIAEKHRKEEEERRRKLNEERIKLQEEQRSIHEQERNSRILMESRATAQTVRRRLPLGTDRNHNRYWIFCDGVPGLYVEKGWVGKDIEYCTMSSPLRVPSSPVKNQFSPVKLKPDTETKQSSDEDDVPLSQLSTPTKKKSRFRKSKDEASWPHPSQNLWLSVNTEEELEHLMKNLLNNGLRESKLRDALKKNYDCIVRSINKKQQIGQQQEFPTRRSALPSDGEELHVTMLRKQMTSMVNDATRGGLSELSEPEVVLQQIATAENVQDYSEVLVEIFDSIPPRFLRHYFTGISDKKKSKETEISSEREKNKAEKRVEKWRQAVAEATLYSRINLLSTLLNSSINWEMYHYRRQNSRRAVTKNKNYSDINEGIDQEEEDENSSNEDESDEESLDQGQRRSTRIRERRSKRKYDSDGSDNSSNIPQRPTRSRRNKQHLTGPRTRGKRRDYRVLNSGSDSDEDEVEEEAYDDDQEEDDESGASSSQDEDDDDECMKTICEGILNKLIKLQSSQFFREPVDKEEVPDYYDIIENPICLQEILQQILDASDDSKIVEQMMTDVRMLWDNAQLYNGSDSVVVKEGKKMIQSFVKLCLSHFQSSSDQRRLKRLFSTTSRS